MFKCLLLVSQTFPGRRSCSIPNPQKNQSEVWGGLIRLLITVQPVARRGLEAASGSPLLQASASDPPLH